MHRFFRFSIAAALALIALPVCPAAGLAGSGTDALRATANAFTAVHSFRGTIRTQSGRAVTVEYARPDRYRMMTPAGEMVMIGKTTYMKMGGQWMQMTMPASATPLSMIGSPGAIGRYLQHAKVDDLGPAVLNGKPMHRYRVRTDDASTGPVDSTLWIGADSLPYRDDIITRQGPATVIYSDYNAPLTVAPPI